VHNLPQRPADLRPADREDFHACSLHDMGPLICNPLALRDFAGHSRDELPWEKHSTSVTTSRNYRYEDTVLPNGPLIIDLLTDTNTSAGNRSNESRRTHGFSKT